MQVDVVELDRSPQIRSASAITSLRTRYSQPLISIFRNTFPIRVYLWRVPVNESFSGNTPLLQDFQQRHEPGVLAKPNLSRGGGGTQ